MFLTLETLKYALNKLDLRIYFYALGSSKYALICCVEYVFTPKGRQCLFLFFILSKFNFLLPNLWVGRGVNLKSPLPNNRYSSYMANLFHFFLHELYVTVLLLFPPHQCQTIGEDKLTQDKHQAIDANKTGTQK